ncbi:septal ring lytic transglycosylase RlpA family protein [Celerinatantimonas sp. YJH-8]|uniref:septal ring lytic transglycosylase RlpA family protein n=1 Tax=Celerinatantimonas sp. YJH-8 TaxID=3228714 RepID=UPI0038C59C23
MPISRNLIYLIVVSLLLSACSTPSRYALPHDQTPTNPPKLGWIEDAHPRVEPLSKGGNKDYSVDGKHYRVWRDIKSYQQTGTASWYGLKFHGHRTSNGEIYDMYSMSAAHKNLPLPSYVRVTNLTNHRSVIVRVNDRGPFHSQRIIDLSYAAAYKLDMLASGTAPVQVTLIDPTQPAPAQTNDPTNKAQPSADKPIPAESQMFVQLLAVKTMAIAQQQQKVLEQQGYPAVIVKSGDWLKLRIGPYANRIQALQTKEKIQKQYEHAFIVTLDHSQDSSASSAKF